MKAERKKMKVSAVIPTFNRRNYIRRAIDSVLAQTVPVDEILVIDDGSTDGTAEAIQQWYGPAVRVFRQKQAGVSGARRTGIQQATGEWIAFLDSDDEWTTDRHELLLDAASKVPSDVAWIFGDMRQVSDQGEGKTFYEEYGLHVPQSPHIFDDPIAVQYPFQFGMLQGSFIRRSALLACDCFSAGLKSDDDLLTGFEIACRYKFAAIPDVVAKYYRTSDLSASSVVVNGVFGPDYFRSRMISFGLVVETGRRSPWNKLYAAEVRGLCKVLAQRGPVSRKLALQQFRYGGVSLKGLAFACAAMAGRAGIQTWVAVAAARRRYLFA